MVSTARLYVLRATYLLIFLFLTTSIWPVLFNHTQPFRHMTGVAFCLLAGMAPLVLLGLRYPLKMLPILFFELSWKSIWVLAIGLPLWSANQLDADTFETFKACVLGMILFPLVIPWPYVIDTYFRARGDRWRRADDAPTASVAALQR